MMPGLPAVTGIAYNVNLIQQDLFLDSILSDF